MTSAFQQNAFQTNAFQIEAGAQVCTFQDGAFQTNAFQPCTGAVPPHRAGGIVVGRRRRRDPWQQGFTQRRWEELQLLLAAERRASEHADELKSPSARRALDTALDVAGEAIEKVERETGAVELLRMLDATARVAGMRRTIAHANALTALARRIIEAEAEDEDDALILLLS